LRYEKEIAGNRKTERKRREMAEKGKRKGL
jgi:hypothetical protein